MAQAPEHTSTEQQVVRPAHAPYVDKVVGALGALGIIVPEYEVEDDDVRKAYIQVGPSDPDTGREIYLCWNEESGWYRGVDQNGSGTLNLLRWAHLDVLPDPDEVARWVVEQAGRQADPQQMQRPRYRDSAGLDTDDFASELANAGDTHPVLIDLNTGTIFEWVYQANGTGLAGYANAADHDFTWSREALESEGNLEIVEYADIDHATLARLATEKGWS